MKNLHKHTFFISLLLIFFISTSCKMLHLSDKSKKVELSEDEKLAFKKYLYDASKYKMLGDNEKAISLFSACIDIDPNSAVCYYEIAGLSVKKEDYQTALVYSAKSVELQANNYWYNILYAELFQSAGYFKEASEAYVRIIKIRPQKVELYIQLSSLYAAQKKTKDAFKILSKAEKRFGISDLISVQKEKIYLTLGDYDKAEVELKKLSNAFPQDIRYLGMLAEFYYSIKNTEKALETYNYILSIDSTNGIVHLSLADFYRSQKKYDEAFQHLEIAFLDENVNIDIKVQMLASFIEISKEKIEYKQKAYSLIDNLLKMYPEDPKVHTMNADYLIQDKKYEKAKNELQYVVKTVKDKYLIWEQLLLLESDLSNFESMYAESKEALEYFPAQPLLYLFNGLSAIDLTKYPEAILSLSIGVNIIVDNNNLKVQFYTYLADAFRKNGSNKDSDESFDKLLKIDPNNRYALNNYSYYLSLRAEKLDKAEEMSKKVTDLEPNNITYLDTYAWVLFKQKKYKAAKEVLQTIVEAGDLSSAVIIEHYGDILYNLGEKEEAKIQWSKAKEKGIGSKFLDVKIKDGIFVE